MSRPWSCPAPAHATYEPKPKQMADLSNTKIYFAIGVPFENAWLEKIAAANPDMRVVHTDHGIEKLAMAAHNHHDDHEKKNIMKANSTWRSGA
jgi:zinc transport system substrate-binding protein